MEAGEERESGVTVMGHINRKENMSVRVKSVRIEAGEETVIEPVIVADSQPRLEQGLVSVSSGSLTKQDLVDARSEAGTASIPVLASVQELVIVTAENYNLADGLLHKIKLARIAVKTVIESRIDRIIKPIRTGLDKLYEERRNLTTDLDGPLEAAERVLKGKMAAYQTEVRRLAEEQRAAERREAERLRLEEEAVARAIQQAKNAAERKMLEDQVTLLQHQQEVARSVIAAPRPVARLAGVKSSVRETKRARITDLDKLLKAIAAEEIPATVIKVEVDEKVVLDYYAADKEMVESWETSGVEVYVDIGIAK